MSLFFITLSPVEKCVCLVKVQVFLTQLRRGGSLGDSGEGPGGLFICLSSGEPASHAKRENALRTTEAVLPAFSQTP